MIELGDVTIVNVNCIDVKTAVKALRFSCKHIKFKSAVLLTSKPQSDFIEDSYFKWQIIEPLNSIRDYNQFMLTRLIDMIDTEYCLVIQNDGFVINPHLWNDNFKKYDYIGAPWSRYAMKVWGRTNQIGNGGFSFRSRRLLDFLKHQKDIDFNEAEDVTISRLIELHDFKYPDVKTACSFSLECPVEDEPFDLKNCFGFHGTMIYNNLITLCPNVLSIKNS